MDDEPPHTVGFDACVPLGIYVGGLAAAGVRMVGRYVAPGVGNVWKVIAPSEAVELAIACMPVWPIFETTGRPNGAAEGNADGRFTARYLPTVGLLPHTGVVIYPTVDFDAQPDDVPGIAASFRAFGLATPGYELGAYAGGYVNERLVARRLIVRRWLTASQGYLGTEAAIAAGDYDMIQRVPEDITVNAAGINVDPDSLHMAKTDIGARVPWGGAVRRGATLSAAAIQMLLNKAGQQPPLDVDDVSGNLTKAALRAWLRGNGFTSLDWDEAIPALLAQAGVAIYEQTDAA